MGPDWQGSTGYDSGGTGAAEAAGGELNSAPQPDAPVPPTQSMGTTEADVHAASAWLLYHLAPFCGRHMRKASTWQPSESPTARLLLC